MEEKDIKLKGNKVFVDDFAENIIEMTWLQRLFLNLFGEKIVAWDSNGIDTIEFIYMRKWNNRLYVMDIETQKKSS